MAEETQVDGVTKLRQLVEEFTAHKARLQARGIEIGELVTQGKLDDTMLRQVVVEQFLELHDTALSLQADFAQVMLDEYEGALADPEAAPDEPYEDEDDSLLLHSDAAQLRRTTGDYLELLTELVGRYEGSERRSIEEKIAQAKQSLTLIDEIEEADDDESEDTESDDGEDAAGDGRAD